MITRSEAISAFGAGLADAREKRAELFARMGGGWEGALAVGQAAHPHDPQKAEEVARKYLGWVLEDLAERASGAA